MSFPPDPTVPQQPPAAPTNGPAAHPTANPNQSPHSASGNGYSEQLPAQAYPNAPLQPVPASKPSRKQLWIGLGVGFAAGVIVSVLVAGTGSALASATQSHVLQKSVDACSLAGDDGVSLGDNGASLTIDTKGEEDSSGASWADAACVLKELKVPDSVVAQIDSTSALQGRQTATWESVEASWTYHPDSGVKIIITNAKN